MMILIARVLAYCPLIVLHAAGCLAGWLVYFVSPSYRRTFNAMTARLGYGPFKLFKFRCKAIGHAGKSLFELPYIWFSPAKGGAVSKVRCHNREVMDQARAKGKGILFLTPHLGCFEVTPQKIAETGPITVLYRPHRKPALQAVIEAARARGNLDIAPASTAGVRKLLRALKNGEAVGLLPDQVPSNGEGLWANFFGEAAYTMTLPVKLQHATGATIVFVIGERLSWGRGYVMRCFAGPAALPDDVGEAVTQINQCLESLIRICPEQYMWAYNRYKKPKGR